MKAWHVSGVLSPRVFCLRLLSSLGWEECAPFLRSDKSLNGMDWFGSMAGGIFQDYSPGAVYSTAHERAGSASRSALHGYPDKQRTLIGQFRQRHHI